VTCVGPHVTRDTHVGLVACGWRGCWFVCSLTMLLFQGYFIVKSLKKSLSCPNNNRGVTYQSDRKNLADGVEYLYRGAKLVS
jgi:hypothetical protein